MNTQVTWEVALFKLKPETDIGNFCQEMGKINLVLQGYEGFLSRELLYSAETGQWVDVVRWSSMENALKAAALFPQEPCAQTLMPFFAEGELTMLHVRPVSLDK